MYFPKIDKYEKLFEYVNDKSDKVSDCQVHCPLRVRGEAYFVLAAFQKDGLKKAELSEQSMKLYSKLLEEIFKEEMIQQYMQKDDKLLLHNYSVIIRQVFENYKIVIGAKVDYLMNLPEQLLMEG